MTKDQRDIAALWAVFIEKQQGSVLLWCVVAMGIGIAWYFSRSYEPDYLHIYGTTVISGILVLLTQKSPYKTMILLIFMVAFGVSMAAWRTQHLATVILHQDLRAQMVTGTVMDYEPAATGWRVVLNDLEFENLRGQHPPQKIRVTIRQKSYAPTYQQRLRVYARIMAPSPPLVSGAYDFQRHAYFQGLGGYGFALGDPEIIKQGLKESCIVDTIRHHISKKILATEKQPASGVITALLTGQRKTILANVKDSLRDAGLAHLLAISGLHVGLLAGIVFYFTRMGMVLFTKPQYNIPIKKISALIALVATIVYMLLVGSPVSTQRATIMTGLVLIAVMTDRLAITMRLVAIAAFIILVMQPESLMQPGFQMSFSAVIGLVAFYRGTESIWFRFRYRAGWVRKALLYLSGVTATTVIATISTAPFALYHFQQISILGFIANMLAMPIMAFWVMPAGVLTYIFMLVGFESLPLMIMSEGVDAIRIIADWVSSMDGAVKRFAVMPSNTLVILVTGFLFLCFIKGRLRMLGVIPLSLGFFLAINPPVPIAFIEGNGKMMGYVPINRDAPLLLNIKADRFSRDILQQLSGREQTRIWRYENLPEFSCDDWGCLARRQNQLIAFVEHPAALERDCQKADLIFSSFPVKRKCKAWVVDKFDVWRHGGHIVYPHGKNKFTIRNVNQVRGIRPWTDQVNE